MPDKLSPSELIDYVRRSRGDMTVLPPPANYVPNHNVVEPEEEPPFLDNGEPNPEYAAGGVGPGEGGAVQPAGSAPAAPVIGRVTSPGNFINLDTGEVSWDGYRVTMTELVLEAARGVAKGAVLEHLLAEAEKMGLA